MSAPKSAGQFEVVVEVEPATTPDLGRVRRQVDRWAGLADGFLIPDNHLGRATVSSIAVAHEVAALGVPAIACLNCRDRNRLGLRRDLLTAAAYGVDRLLCVYGDQPSVGGRAGDLNVAGMVEEIRNFGGSEAFTGGRPVGVGVTTRLRRLPAWKLDADFLFVQAVFDLDRLLDWRSRVSFEGPVYAAVLVVASAAMAKTIAAATAEIDLPDGLLRALESDPDAGLEAACALLDGIVASGAFDGVHLVPASRSRALAARLARQGFGEP